MKMDSHPTVCLVLILILGQAGGTALAGTKCVWPDSPSPAPPCATWAMAARTIQAAVDAGLPGDTNTAPQKSYRARVNVP